MATRQERVNSCKLKRHAAPPFASMRETKSLVFQCRFLLSVSLFPASHFCPSSLSLSPSPPPPLILPFLIPSQDRVNVNNSCLSSLRQKCDTHTHTHTHTHLKHSNVSGTGNISLQHNSHPFMPHLCSLVFTSFIPASWCYDTLVLFSCYLRKRV